MDYGRPIGVVISVMLLVCVLSCSAPAGMPLALSLSESLQSDTSPANDADDEFEAIRQAADAYVNSGRPLTISAQNVNDNIRAVNPLYVQLNGRLIPFELKYNDPLTFNRGPFIIDVRPVEAELRDPYSQGHIPGSLHVSWQQLTIFKNIKNMPRDRQVVIASSTGEAGVQVAAILNVMGYEAVALEWGMASWAGATASPFSYEESRDTLSDWGAYYTSGSADQPTETYDLPTVENTESNDSAAITYAAADAYLADRTRQFDMKASDLYQALDFEPQTAAQIFLSTFFTGSATGNPYTRPFILDIRDSAAFNGGHLIGALNVYLKDVFKTESLEKLPPDRQVLVYGDNGHESSAVTALLNLLGYDARNLRWGTAADQFVPERDCMNYQVVTGLNPFLCTS